MQPIEDNYVCIDIETIPGSPRPELPEGEFLKSLVLAAIPKRFKKQASINAYAEEHFEELADEVLESKLKEWRKEAVDPWRGKIACIGIAVGEDPAYTISAESEDGTTAVLSSLLMSIEEKTKMQPRLYGHNFASFDARFLFSRALAHGRRHLAAMVRPGKWGSRVGDTRAIATQGNPKDKVSLDNLCKALGIATPKQELPGDACEAIGVPPGTTLDGSMVERLWFGGFRDLVIDYCRLDVEATRDVYRTIRDFAD